MKSTAEKSPVTDADTLIASVGKSAEKHFSKGFCCAEAVLLSVIEHLRPDTPREVLRLATGFGGGLGGSGGLCGIYAGGTMAIGLFFGRTEADEDDAPVDTRVREFVTRLEAEAKAQRCDDIVSKWPFGLGRRKCRRLTGRGAEIAAEIIYTSSPDVV